MMEKEITRYFNRYFNLKGIEQMKFEDIDWIGVYMYEKLTDEFIEKTFQYLKYLDYDITSFDTVAEKWKFVFEYNQVSETMLRKHHSEFDREVWSVISAFQELSEDFMCEFKDELDWLEISQNQRFSEEFAVQFKLLLDWEAIIGRNIFTFDFILQNAVLSDGVVSRLGQKYTAEIKNLLEKYRSEGKK